MREQKILLDSFVPKHESEWDAKLFIDSSIKQNVEFTLEVLARALSGVNEVRFEFHQEAKSHFIYQETDEGTFPKKTIQYTVEARVDSYCFFGNNKTQVLCQIIDFWAGKQGVFPCGGAHFPNSEVSKKFSDLHQRKFNENDIAQLQTKVHEITGNGEVMMLFNDFLGIQAGS
jgi:hypothetical protein